jgi:hypothetical protein
MSTGTCDLSQGQFNVTSLGQSCNGRTPEHFASWTLSCGSGSAVTDAVRIEGANISLELTDINCTLGVPFVLINSTVSVSLHGSNFLNAENGAFICREQANLAITGTDEDMLFVRSHGLATAIGTDKECGILKLSGSRFTFETEDAPAIGTWPVRDARTSIDQIEIVDSNVSVTTTGYSSGIGTGGSSSDVSIGLITVQRSTVSVRSAGAGIGLAWALGNSSQTNDLTRITNSTVNITAEIVGIGGGESYDTSTLTIAAIEVFGSKLLVQTNGTGIGLHVAIERSRQSSDQINITNSSLNITAEWTCIGTAQSCDHAALDISTIETLELHGWRIRQMLHRPAIRSEWQIHR